LLKLRRGVVVEEQPLIIEVNGERRPAWADETLLGPMREGDAVLVNTEALDLALGSGGFDLVHANLTRGLESGGEAGANVIKLNYTSLQHAVEPVERPEDDASEPGRIPVLVVPLHGHLAPAAWAAAEEGDLHVGYVQTAGGALPGAISRDVVQLRERGLLRDHITAGPAYGGSGEAITVLGALDAASTRGWQAAIVGPGPGILGSATRYGHGGMTALDSAHAALALRMPTLLAPRLSEGDPRQRHRGLSHHTATVLGLLLGEVQIPVPADEPALAASLEQAAGGRHRLSEHAVNLDGYGGSGLPRTSMGRDLEQDRVFFKAPLAAGAALARAAAG
jgi:hypothetical protein